MHIEFRPFPAGALPEPGPGEVLVQRSAAHAAAPPGLAALVLAKGLAALPCGAGADTGKVDTLVVDCAFTAPTFDEMLATSFARLTLKGRPLQGKGYHDLAAYASHLLSGHRPASRVLPEDSIEGIFQAVRNADRVADLSRTAVADRFRHDWARMEAVLLEAAEKGLNPFETSPFAHHPEFARERSFLAGDRRKYQADVSRGERWHVHLPGSPGLAAGLLLRQPESLLFKHWAREDEAAPGGVGYLFLAVDWGVGRWVFTTDPVRPVRIAGLAAHLQVLEEKRDPARANADPWYDGSRPEHAHTLVGAPKVKGTVLSDTEVLRTVRSWARAQKVRPPRTGWPAWLQAACFLALLLSAGGLAWLAWKGQSHPPTNFTVVQNGRPAPAALAYHAGQWHVRPAFQKTAEGIAVAAGEEVSLQIAPAEQLAGKKWQGRVRLLVRRCPRDLPEVRMGHSPGKLKEVRALGRPSPSDGALFISPEEFSSDTASAVYIDIHNRTKEAWTLDYEVDLLPRTLHVLAVGASDCAALGALSSARQDAEVLAQVMEKQEGRLFEHVTPRVLTGPDCTRDEIYKGLKWLKSATPSDMALVLLSGHGERDRSGSYLFAPNDYDKEVPGRRGISGQDLVRELFEVPCPVLVLVDSCHSGALAKLQLLGEHPGIGLFTSTLPEDVSKTRPECDGHGSLVFALLEVMRDCSRTEADKGQPVFTPPGSSGLVSWRDLRDYLPRRVSVLSNKSEAPQDKWLDGKDYGQYPITALVYPAR